MGSETIDILVVGGGGREHALCWKLKQSRRVGRLFCAPGNPGIAQVARCVALNTPNSVEDFCRGESIGLVIVGPEQPLVEGLADRLRANDIKVIGPDAAAARLEGSKAFTKALCAANGIPTAAYESFTEAGAAKTYLRTRALPIVVKADGLAAGKGVVVAETLAEADTAVERLAAGGIVIEDFLVGEEASFFALVDGETVTPLEGAQDHKRVGDGDTGPNTGGMGAYSPAPVLTPTVKARVLAEIVEPTARAMAAAGTPFRGVLFAGLMIAPDGAPSLIEYNVRFGDPECQALMMRLDADLVDVLLGEAEPAWRDEAALAVVMAANGYPGTPEAGSVVAGVEAAEAAGATVFHAGTARADDGALIAAGGRVLAVAALGTSVGEAAAAAYRGVDAIDWPGGFCRRDIGRRAIEREQA